jgi:hypothetical protein
MLNSEIIAVYSKNHKKYKYMLVNAEFIKKHGGVEV